MVVYGVVASEVRACSLANASATGAGYSASLPVLSARALHHLIGAAGLVHADVGGGRIGDGVATLRKDDGGRLPLQILLQGADEHVKRTGSESEALLAIEDDGPVGIRDDRRHRQLIRRYEPPGVTHLGNPSQHPGGGSNGTDGLTLADADVLAPLEAD